MFVPRSVKQTTSNEGNTHNKPFTTVHEEAKQHEDESNSDEEDIVLRSTEQRLPDLGEPICVVCGRYGAYIVDETNVDVCSIECKYKHLEHVKRTTDTREEDTKELSMDELNSFHKEMQLEVKGSNIPKPITAWSQLSLNAQLSSNLTEWNYSSLTPVQMQVIPAVLKKRDLLVCSSTGSGKSLAFLLPLIHQLSIEGPSSAHDPRVLILGPTRELCMQIEELAKQLMKGIPNMLTALLVGGIPLATQLHRLKSDIQLVVATPARLQDILIHHASSLNLSHVLTLVLDEVDSLLKMGFKDQIKSIECHLPKERQNLLFSATVPPDIEQFAIETLNNPLFIAVGVPSTPNVNIKHTVIWVEEEAKKKRLFSFLSDKELFHPPAVVFVNSRKGTLLLADAINKVSDVAAIALHGEMEQERRTSILSGFLNGRYDVIVATGMLARGLDLKNVRQVFNFDLPSSIDEFVHQVGRASRLDSQGWAITFINNENKGIFANLVDLLEPNGVELPSELLQSQHLHFQRKRKCSQSDDTNEKKEKQQKIDYRNKDSLFNLLQNTSRSRKRKY